LIRLPEEFLEAVPLPPTFGGMAYRGRLGGQPALLLALDIETGGPEPLAARTRRWESLAPGAELLARPLKWFLEGGTFFVAFHDPGGPLISDLLSDPQGWPAFDGALLPFLDLWGQLVAQESSLCVVDPARLVLGPRGLVSFDLVHLVDLEGRLPSLSPAFTVQEDLLVLSPEMTSRTALTVGLQSGLFSLGTLIYRFVSGRWPLEKTDVLERIHTLLNQLPDFSDGCWQEAGPVLTALILKLLQKDPRDRYQTIRGLKWDLGKRGASELGPFQPGVHDRPLPLSEAHRIYGRDAELTLLGSTLEHLQSGRPVALLFRGAAGQGKSRLIDDFRRRCESEGVFWLQGKFDQFEPRFATGALAQIIDQWVAQPRGLSQAVGSGWTEALRNQLGRQLRVVTTLIPALLPYLGESPELVPLNPEESQQRFVRSMVTFFSLVAAVRPMVMTVEDLHWADDLSLKVLDALVSARIPRLAFVATCRPGIPQAAKDLILHVESGPGPGIRELGPLDEKAVFELLGDCSALEAEDRRSLARTLVRFGDGNPLSVRILIREVNLRQAAVFDEASGRWTLLQDRLRDLPENQALTLLVDRMESLAPEVRRALLVASLMGGQILKGEVLAAGEISATQFDQVVEELLELGIWERSGPAEYRFGHDKIQKAAYETATEAERGEAHLRVGREWLRRFQEGATVSAASVASHLNRCAGDLTDDERGLLVEVNVLAGEAARLGNDFAGSLKFYQAAVSLAGADLWDRDADRAWGLYKAAAEAAYTEFRRDLGDSWSDEAAGRVKSPLARAQIRERQQSYLFSLGDIEGSIQAGIRGLKEVGVSIPRRPSAILVATALLGVKLALAGRSTDALAHQTENRNERSRIILLLLSGFIPPAFHSGEQNLFGLAVLKATRLTLHDGVSRESAPGYTGYALLLAALGDLKGAYDFGRLAVRINERYDDLTWRSMVLVLTGLFCFGWFEPWEKLRPRFEEARQASEESGDVLYLTYAQLFTTLWNPGEDLPKRRQRTEEALDLILKTRFPMTRVSAYFALGALKNLEGTSDKPLSFHAPGFDPDEGMEEYRRVNSLSGLAVCHTDVLATSFLLGDLDKAKAALGQAETLRTAVAGSLYQEELTLFAGLVSADLARRGEPFTRKLSPLVRQARRWAALSPTFQFHAHLLKAEWLDLKNRVLEAQTSFLAAIEAADKAGTMPYQALARERAARFFRRRGSEGLAGHFLTESLDRWRRYGAWAKVELIQTESRNLFSFRPVVVERPEPALDVDRVSLVRAFQAISGEIRIDALSQTITKLILENSGADRVVLLVVAGGELIFQGESTAQGYRAGANLPLMDLADLPQALLREAFVEGKLLVREEVTAQDRRREPVLVARGVKSLIVLPLVSPDGTHGLVYLENKVMSGILSFSRVRIVELLSSAIGLAIQNAHLFRQVEQAKESLEIRVEQRTKELGASQKRIALQEKLASLGALTAGIAHELKNPINIINNFSESSTELMEELRDDLDSVRDVLPEPVRQSLDYLIPELVRNMEDIKKHGVRGNEIIRSMLMHARSDADLATLEDLNSVVQESMGLAFHGWRAHQLDFDCTLETDLDSRLPPVRMIRANLERVLINLLNNAFHAVGKRREKGAPGYRPRVLVSTKWLDPGVLFQVEDNGPGIHPEILEKVFQPFFTTKPPGEGSGLGLSISHEIIREDFGGSMEVQSEVDRFTRFVVNLPPAGKGS